MVKRLFDLTVAGVGIVALLPLIAAIAVLIKCDSPGPVFFRQRRVGRAFRPFWIFKFRTMVHGAARNGPSITAALDPRVTRVGRLLRRWKVDEIPQLINVVRGEMSLVGPRPEVDEYVELFRDEFRELLSVRPGITDLASVQFADEERVLAAMADPLDGYRTTILRQKIQLARESIRRSSLRFDVGLLARTFFSVFVRRRATFDQPVGDVRSRPTPTMIMTFTQRRIFVVAIHVLAVVVANYLGFWLRFDGRIPEREIGIYIQTLPWLLVIRWAMFVPFQLYQGLWRYTSVYDLRRILLAVGASTALFVGVVQGILRIDDYPRSVFIVDALLLVFFMGGLRLGYRSYRELKHLKPQRRVLIYGAGDAGEMIVRDIKRYHAYEPVGFVDDNPQKTGRRIHGVAVLGTRTDLPQILSRERPHEVLVAIPGAEPATVRSIVKVLEPFKMPIRTLPNLRDMTDCRVTVTEIRDLSIEDLLTRAPVGLDIERIRDLVAGRRVLVTGAGGSIGSELSRQIADLQPERLLLYERYENSLYTVTNDLERCSSIVRSMIGDVTDRRRLDAVLGEHRPHVIFHAAAHKHVPLMELNVCEAVKNNVTGTRRVAQAAERHGVEQFVLISSDKAVNPSSVMGATKRVAELTVRQQPGHAGPTRFSTVRFGNVLGSNGSVVPRFLGQIKAGGPVTVTHPEMRRFFMLIPEAVQLVLHAAALGEDGALYVLDMGEQVKLLDIARTLIRLSGFVPDEEIPIVFTGPRPGEKLFEELMGTGESLEPSAVDKILRVRSEATADVEGGALTMKLERAASRGNSAEVLTLLSTIVPTFRPVSAGEANPSEIDAIDEAGTPLVAVQAPWSSPARSA